jgi:Ca2+-binding RTX toxin-like protein
MASEIGKWFEFALQQLAAESHLDGIDWTIIEQVEERLLQGNTDPQFPASGYTRLPPKLARDFMNRYAIVAHRANDATGFSATLLRWTNDQEGTEYTLSVRSTEYKTANEGGDRERDGLSGADGSIVAFGFAFAQLAALENFYEMEVLPIIGGARLNVTGYSLGGHLATVFTETHPDRVKAAYVFNSAGRGVIGDAGGVTPERMTAMINYFRATLTSEPSASAFANIPRSDPGRARYEVLYQAALQAHFADPGWNPFAATDTNLYNDPRYVWARTVTTELAGFPAAAVGAPREGLGTPGDALVTSVFGAALSNDVEIVANSQVHPSNKNEIFIEGQPFVEGVFPIEQRSDFGNTHAITLLVDSLALMKEFERLDPALTKEKIESFFKAASAQKSKAVALLSDPEAAEGDSLERTLLALRRVFDRNAPAELPVSRIPGGFGDLGNRELFYQELGKLPKGTYEIVSLTEKSAEEIRALAREESALGLAVRYALRQLNPFAVVGPDLYGDHNGSGELDLGDSPSGGSLSEQYIRDRAEFLYWKSRAFTENQTSIADVSAPSDTLFIDAEQAVTVERRRMVFGSPSTALLANYQFGSTSNPTITGTPQGDHLFGGPKGETISGGFGNDYLEGGGGLDRLSGGPGDDTLADFDGGRGDRLDGGTGFDTYIAEFGDTIVDTPEAGAGAVYVYVDGQKVQLPGGWRNEGEAFYTSDDDRFKYWADGRGAVAVYRASVGAGDAPLRIEAPSAPVPGFVDTGTQSIRGRPDLGMALVEFKDPNRVLKNSKPSADVKTLFDLAKTFRPSGDPLALDLGGNGFQTVGDLGEGTVLFDHDAVGVRNGTGWLTGVDAFVVLDRDGDGAITSGRELFGDNTLLPDGSTGADGFAAIAPMDTNGDQVIDANDAPLEAWQVPGDADGDGEVAPGETRGATFDDLLLWRDENLNGISEPFELGRLSDYGIASIDLAKTFVNQSLPGGNTLRYRGTFTLQDGTTGTAGALNLTRETFYREYTTAPAYEPGVEGLPVIGGTGRVRDLQEAAADSPALRQLVEAAVATPDRAAQAALTEQIIRQWAADSAMPSGAAESAARTNSPVLVYNIPGIGVGSIGSAYTNASGGLPVNPADLPAGWYEAQQSQQYRDAANRISTLERFTGQTFADVRNSSSALVYTQTFPPEEAGDPAQTVNVYSTTVSIGAANFQFLQDAHALLQEAVEGSIAVQTRLLPYVEAVLAGAASRDFSQAEALLLAKRLTDPAGALADLVELGKYAGADLIAKGWTSLPLMINQWAHDAQFDASLASTLADLRVAFRDDSWGIPGGPTGDVLIGTPWEPPFASGALRQSVGGFGDDLIFSDTDFEVLSGGRGNDILYGGPAGEVIAPGLGRDIILFGRGSGIDQVDSWSDPDIRASVATFGLPILPATDRDAVYMLPEVAPDDVRVRFAVAPYYAYFGAFTGGLFEGVALSIRGTDDVLYDAGFSAGGTTNNNFRSIEEVHFADGTVWDLQTLRLKQGEGTELDDRAGAEGVLRGFEDTDDVIDGKGGNDRLEGLGGNDTLIGGAGNDELLGGYGDDLLIGGDGDDTLEGYFGTDVLNGGPGDDRLYGGPGLDYYILARGNGADLIVNSNAFTYSGLDPTLDVVRVESDIASAEVLLQRRSNGLHIIVEGGNAELWDAGAGGPTDPNPDYIGESWAIPSIGRIEFADGTVWNGQEIKARSLLGATEGNDEFYGFETSGDTIAGRGGDDLIRGLGGDDVLSGDDGNDTLEGAFGDDVLFGGEGNDILRAGAGNDTLWGGEGDDELHGDDLFVFGGDDVLDGGAGNDMLYGDDGNDLLRGGSGDDLLFGGAGSDIALFGVGGGQDTAHGVEILRFEASATSADVTGWSEGNDLVFRIESSGDMYRSVDGRTMLARVEFSDGALWDATALAGLPARATEANDTLYGTEGDDVIAALGGNDIVYGYGGNDFIDGGAGADTMHGGAGDDTYAVENGSDQVVELADQGHDTVLASVTYDLGSRPHVEDLRLTGGGAIAGYGNALPNAISGNSASNTLYGRGGDDLLSGGAGDDQLFGGDGNDLYVYAPGDGFDSIHDSPAEQNVLRLSSITPGEVVLGGSLASGLITIGFTGTTSDGVSLNSTDDSGIVVASIEFGDGTVWSQQDIIDRLPPPPPPSAGTPGDDALIGDDQANYLAGLGGNDVIYGAGGDDTLVGGPGDDVLIGGPGSDAYTFSPGDGSDQVIDEPSVSRFTSIDDGATLTALLEEGELNTVTFNPGVTSASIELGVNDEFLLVRSESGGIDLRIGGFDRWDPLGAHAIKAFVFVDFAAPAPGEPPQPTFTVLSHVDLLARGFDLFGTGADETILGTNVADRIDGGPGSDLLVGGAGSDTYAFAPGSGADTIREASSLVDTDVLQVAANPGDVTVSREGDNLVLALYGTADRVTVEWFADPAARIEEVRFADGTSWDAAMFEAQAPSGGDGAPAVANAIADQNGTEDAAFSFTVPENSFSDSDSGDTLTYSASLASGAELPAWLSFNASTGVFSGTPRQADVGSIEVRVTATDPSGLSASDTFALSVANVNDAPVVSAANATAPVGQAIAASSFFSVADEDGDAMTQFQFYDPAGGGAFTVNGAAPSGQNFYVNAADLANVSYVAGAVQSTEWVQVRAYDGLAWSAWKSWSIGSAAHATNAAPLVSAADAMVQLGESVNAGSFFGAADADGDSIVQYQFYDSVVGGGGFRVNGVAPATQGFTVNAVDLANVTYLGAATQSTETVQVRAYDGLAWGAWKQWNIGSSAHPTNAAPVLTAADATVPVGGTAAAGTLFSVSDADDDAIQRYQLKDLGAGGGAFTVDGTGQASGVAFTVEAANLAGVAYAGAFSQSTETVMARAYDGLAWSAWQQWNMGSAAHEGNATPVATASDAIVLLDQAVDAASFFSVADADGDPMVQYQFYDSVAGGGGFTVNGRPAGQNFTVNAADLSNVRYVGASTQSIEGVKVRASDGLAWSAWAYWNIGSSSHPTNAAPVVAAADAGLLLEESIEVSSLFAVSDADGDAIQRYEFQHLGGAGGVLTVNGVAQASGQAVSVAAADLVGTTYAAGATPGVEWVKLRAYDGLAWSAWQGWNMHSVGGMRRGGAGDDMLTGDAATPVLEGNGGNDTLNAGSTNSLLSGGEGNDALNGAAGDDFLAGGSGDDVLTTGEGNNLIAYNAGGGTDTVVSAAGAQNTLSFGGGIGYDDLSLSKEGNDLVVNAGANDRVVLKDWYAGMNNVLSLQIILEATAAFDASSADPLYNKKVQSFDFLGIVNAFDAALAQSPGLTSWAVTNALLQFHLSGADDFALGGDLAYWYGKNGSLAGIGLAAAQQVIGAAGFGSEAQTLRPFSGLQEGLVKLS